MAPLGLRIAIGRCECQKPYRDPIQTKACSAIEALLKPWEAWPPRDLAAVPTEAHQSEWIDGHEITFGTYKEPLPEGGTLVVFQALVHTLARPTFFALGSVGRMYAEGLVVSADGAVNRAPDEIMRAYR